MSFQKLGICWLIIAAVLLVVEMPLLAIIFGVLGVLALIGKLEQAKTPAAPPKKTPAVKKIAPDLEQSTNVNNQNSLTRKQDIPSDDLARDAYAFRGTVDQYFLKLLQTDFSGYQVEQNVNLGSLNTGASSNASWTCSCGSTNTGKFCTECGSSKPSDTGWTCACGEHNTGKYCSGCGKSRPAAQTALDVPANAAHLNFLLRQNGKPKAGIILCDKHEWDTEQISITMEACRKAGIPCLRFFREFRNEVDYVTQRIRKALR